MSEQVQREHATKARDTDEQAAPTTGDQAPVRKMSEMLDDLIDEIDGVLEENAEEFVQGFKQLGGE